MITETKYSRTEFDGYTHRFIVKFQTDAPNDSNLNIYSNSDSYKELYEFICEHKGEKVSSFNIIHRTTKEQDDLASQLLDEVLKGI